jgi:MEMO1 family protein
MKGNKRVVHKAHGGGRWFSGGHAALVAEIEGYMARADVPTLSGRIVGGIAPHAGYVYSGGVAGYTFRALQEDAAGGEKPETIVILGFSHSEGFSGVALLDGDAIATPVGEAALDRDSGAFLVAASDRIHFDSRPHQGEHSAENEIPFAQSALPASPLVVGLLGDHETATVDALAAALHQLSARKRIVVVASTDLLHDASYDRVAATDRKTLAMIAALDETGLKNAWSPREQVCCGIGPVLTLLEYAKMQGVESGILLKYRNSGDDHPESRGSWVVGYGSVVFAVDE